MSQQQGGAAVGTPPGDTFADDGVAEYLKSHPDFFERHPLLLLSLKLPHRTGGAAISLVERQVAVLRQRNAQLERQFKDLVAVAKQNDALVEKIHQLSLKLMRAPSLPARLEQLETGLREDFAAERAALVLFPSAPASAVREGFVKRLAPDDADVRPFAAFVRAAKPRCGPLRDRQKNIFDQDADLVSSAAFVPLGAESSLGFLIIGSRDADHFHPGKRMDFLARLGELLAVVLSHEQL
ncbi:MAG TPA: DUF484 family protein [Gammaproteobacteria bacterium]|jgi:uncharacterized protein YigA (DUF484 family)|nr:DUF484 family protein [Gammaproteobacteria bacterium]